MTLFAVAAGVQMLPERLSRGIGGRRGWAGSSPARAPMMTAAARPPAQAWGGMTTGLAVAAGVGGGGGDAED